MLEYMGLLIRLDILFWPFDAKQTCYLCRNPLIAMNMWNVWQVR